MTEAEIQQLSGRLEVAKKLDLGFSQRSVSEETDVSIATVTRISKVLNGAVKGYRLVLDRINGK
ncbi:UNVERIFIED_CONTAM: hypothetical protein GTU68_048865 [Idotea baltica]|nr:hypothetical protein [Idotea baltica]